MITYEQVKSELLKLANENSDYVYPRRYLNDADRMGYCDYVRDNQPSCIVGKVFNVFGISVNELREYENRPADIVAKHNGKVEFEDKAGNLLNNAQIHQDIGTPWGEAVKRAIDWTKEEPYYPDPI